MTRQRFSRLRRTAIVALAGAVLAGCAAPARIGPDTGTAFQRTGRFAVTVKEFSGKQDAVQGGFAWMDTGQVLTLDLSNPLGSTLARVTVDNGLATLTHSNGSQEYAPHADALVEKVLGSPVPVAGLRAWLRGQAGQGKVDNVRKDEEGRLTSFTQQGWRVSLSRYDVLGPTLLQLTRSDAQRDISVRLAIAAQSQAQ